MKPWTVFTRCVSTVLPPRHDGLGAVQATIRLCGGDGWRRSYRQRHYSHDLTRLVWVRMLYTMCTDTFKSEAHLEI